MTVQRLSFLVVGTAVMLAAVSASAQTPAPPAPPQPQYGAPIMLDQAKKIMAGAEAEAKKNNWPVVITILDSGGQLVMSERLDGAQFGSIEVAREKAYAAVAFRRSTKVFEDGVAQGGVNLRTLRLTGATPYQGGLPIVVDGKVVGGIGVSGVTAPQDAQVAQAGIDALSK